MRPCLVMLHGWGFDRHFWRPLADALPDFDPLAWDLGFFGEPCQPLPPPGRPVLAVGHSYGLLWLLHRRPFAWRSLVSINGFTRFVSGVDFSAGVDPAQLDRMQASLAEAPAATLAGFRQRCGDPGQPPARLMQDRLQQSLQNLRDWDCRRARVDLALCGRQDKVVPPALSQACFDNTTILWHDGAHLLPQQDPDWCAEQLRCWMTQSA